MKFQPDRLEGVNLVTRHEPGRVWIGEQLHTVGVLIPWRGSVRQWKPSEFDALVSDDFEAVLELRPEVVIFGSGPRLRFASPSLYRPLIERRIGIETMDTAAACRTYNVLASEGRAVVAALLIGRDAMA